MSDPNLEAQIEAARAYEALFVPALLGEWAPRVADMAELAAGQSVLDVACGTGVLTREVRRRTGPSAYVAGLDLSPGMLAVAKELCPPVDWREGNAESMPFSSASFDAIVSQFGLMFMDRDKAPREEAHVVIEKQKILYALGDKMFVMEGPYIVNIPPMVPHSFQNLDDEIAQLVVIFPTNVWEYDVLDHFPFSTPEGKALMEEAKRGKAPEGS